MTYDNEWVYSGLGIPESDDNENLDLTVEDISDKEDYKEADQKRENRVQHIEDKITRAEEKVKSIFKKWGF